jgi:regulator of replication initiation timing
LWRPHRKDWVRVVDWVLSGLARYIFLTQKDNMVVRNLKKLVRESREENESLRVETQKIKKTMKYTKINELEI